MSKESKYLCFFATQNLKMILSTQMLTVLSVLTSPIFLLKTLFQEHALSLSSLKENHQKKISLWERVKVKFDNLKNLINICLSLTDRKYCQSNKRHLRTSIYVCMIGL